MQNVHRSSNSASSSYTDIHTDMNSSLPTSSSTRITNIPNQNPNPKSNPIPVHVQGPPISAAKTFLDRVSARRPQPHDDNRNKNEKKGKKKGTTTGQEESNLLRAIRTALRGSDAELLSTVQSCSFVIRDTNSDIDNNGEGGGGEESWSGVEVRQLTWDASTVVLSCGGVMIKKWNFVEEGEAIQWACLGELEQVSDNSVADSLEGDGSGSGEGRTDATNVSVGNDSGEGGGDIKATRPTFGPFTRAQKRAKKGQGRLELVPGVFVFLRSIGQIYLQNGLQYTFSLPFIIRKAWPASPHGVIIQRVLEPSEFVEAEITGEAVLPTIFSVTSPFAEAAAVGLTTGIIGGTPGTPASLKDEAENSTRPLKSIPPTEMVVWVSHHNTATEDSVLVTIDPEKHKLSVWRYVYVKPKDTPVPLTRTHVKGHVRARQSVSGMASRRASAIMTTDMDGRVDRLHPMSPRLRSQDIVTGSPAPPDMPPLSALLGMPPSLSTTATMHSLVKGGTTTQRGAKGRRNSLTRHDLSTTMNRVALGGRLASDLTLAPIEHGRMRAAYWMEEVFTMDIPQHDASNWRNVSISLFDNRWDGKSQKCLVSVYLPKSQCLRILVVSYGKDNMMEVNDLTTIPAISATSIRATRYRVWDLLVVKTDGSVALVTHGLREIILRIVQDSNKSSNNEDQMYIDDVPTGSHGKVVAVKDTERSLTTLTFEDNWEERINVDLAPKDPLTRDCLVLLALTLSSDDSYALHYRFLEYWAGRNFSTADSVEFQCFTDALYDILGIVNEKKISKSEGPYLRLAHTSSHDRFREDPVMRVLKPPKTLLPPVVVPCKRKPHPLLAPVLYSLHILGEYLRLDISKYDSLIKLVYVICRVALDIRPEWADYWKRLIPEATAAWPSPSNTVIANLDDRLPVWPLDISAILYGRISRPDWNIPRHDPEYIASCFNISPSFEYGHLDPLAELYELIDLYDCLADHQVPESLKRAEKAALKIATSKSQRFFACLPMGIAAPLREAVRTCQLAPPPHWPLSAYKAMGRNDLAGSASASHDVLFNDGYRPKKDFINPSRPRRTVGEIITEAKSAASVEIDAVSGVELDLEDFTDIRFGQDRRLEEVARILCSSTVSSITIPERPELSEHDQAKEHQNQVVRVAERTLALPYGRAMFTFGSVPTVTREAYAIPKLEFSIKIQPLNIVFTPEPGKIPAEAQSWGEFHNGVAAGLRISPTSGGVESSWIAFNKPSDLTPEHAGFLLGLGLTGHLKEMLTWHTFAYLTPKHDLTSIGVLLGLAAANVGNCDQHVTKLIAVHTPALLPTPNVDLNVSLVTQSAGLAGIGLLYLGTKNRRIAEVCLHQISRKDLVQPDLSNEHREAYTYATALAFGMIMLGKGTTIPADMTILSRLSVLIHGDAKRVLGGTNNASFDINLTSPAATIALGLMYLRTERQDVADILTIPDTVLALNRIQPSFLLVRTIARSLIMWNAISPTNEWLVTQIPASMREAMDAGSKINQKHTDDAIELAYYNILAGCCFVVGLKYAGTARQEAYVMIVRYFDLFTRLVYSNGPAFDHKIKRSAVRDGLNLISISLSMVMAGTGEITCLRRLRYAYGMYQQAMYHHGFKYGVHVATHMSLGLLFLGGGRFTLGTSDAAIACMVTAFFPRFHHISSDNRSFLQALRHLWVLAVEPRCLIARDIDTSEVVYLPMKIAVKEGTEVERSQLISPTLFPDIDKLLSIRVDTPRYWPFYLDTATIPRHKEALLRSQTLYVKRRTAFLSYTEDPRGSRSLFVRSGSSAGDAATLDFPQATDARVHPAGELSEFLTSFSNDALFLAFADHLARIGTDIDEDDEKDEHERVFGSYCYAALLDSILRDKPETLQTHLTLFVYRTMSPASRYFGLRAQDLRFAAEFYSRVYDRRFAGESGGVPRAPLVRDTTVLGALHALDARLEYVRSHPAFLSVLGRYARGEQVPIRPRLSWGDLVGPEKMAIEPCADEYLAWYLVRGGVPVSTVLTVLRGLEKEAYTLCINAGAEAGQRLDSAPEFDGNTNTRQGVSAAGRTTISTEASRALEVGIREILLLTGTRMTTMLGSGWAVRSLDEIVQAWNDR